LDADLCFSDGSVSAFDYVNLSPVFCNFDVSNILDIGFNYETENDIFQMWVLSKKRITLFNYFQGQFSQFQDLPLSDTPQQVCWASSTLLLQYKDHLTATNVFDLTPFLDLKTPVKSVSHLRLQYLSSRSVLFASSQNILCSTT
jgi:hypothetical protein